MPASRMHADEVETDVSLGRRLLATQFPHWADLPIEQVRSAGTDNAIPRAGHPPGRTTFFRGVPLENRDTPTL